MVGKPQLLKVFKKLGLRAIGLPSLVSGVGTDEQLDIAQVEDFFYIIVFGPLKSKTCDIHVL